MMQISNATHVAVHLRLLFHPQSVVWNEVVSYNHTKRKKLVIQIEFPMVLIKP